MTAPFTPGEFDKSRDYFSGCSTFAGLARFVPLVGPLSPMPQRPLADVVAEIAAGRAG